MDNKVKYITNDGPYKTTHNVKVTFIMIELSSRKIITHSLQIYNAQDDSGIVYDMIIVCELMVQLVLKDDFGRQILECNDTAITMKEPGNLLG